MSGDVATCRRALAAALGCAVLLLGRTARPAVAIYVLAVALVVTAAGGGVVV